MKILKRIEEKLDRILDSNEKIRKLEIRCSSYENALNKMNDVFLEKDKLINDIIHNIYEQDTSLQLVVMKPYRGKTIVYKDGKRLDMESTTGVDICVDELGHVDATIRSE